MRKLLALVAAGVVLHATTVHAQRIEGLALEEESRVPVAGAIVELLAPDRSHLATATTDSAGVFLFEPRRAGEFILRVTHLPYLPLDSATVRVASGETVAVELRLATRIVSLEPLVVTSRVSRRLREFHERMSRGGFGRFVSREEIDRMPGARPSELLRGMAGVQLVPAHPPGSGNVITMRGGGASGRCMPTIYIDGMVAHQQASIPIDLFLHSDMVEGVEVYTGMTAPAQLLPRGNCGVVAFWTRTDGGRPFSWTRIFTAGGVVGAFLLLTSFLMR